MPGADDWQPYWWIRLRNPTGLCPPTISPHPDFKANFNFFFLPLCAPVHHQKAMIPQSLD